MEPEIAARRYTVVVTDSDFPLPNPEEEVVAQLPIDLVWEHCLTEDEVIAAARDADGLIVQYAPITARVVDQLTRCQVVARYGVGVDTIDVAAATRRGILVANVPDYCVAEVSDHALALLLACARRLFPLNAAVKAGMWDIKKSVGPIYGLEEQTLGLVGFGRMARALATKARVFGFRLLAYDPLLPDSLFAEHSVERVDFASLLRESDYVSVHVPLTPETYHLFGGNVLAAMKPTAYLINTSRGAVIDEEALYEALLQGGLGGAALDVFEQEPPSADNPLLRLDSVIATPHAAFYSEHAMQQLRRRTAEAVVSVLQGGLPSSLLNLQALQVREEAKHASHEDCLHHRSCHGLT